MADLVLHTNPMSRGRIARWMMEEVGAPYETRVVPYGPEGSQGEAFRVINPMGKFPTLVHGDVVVTEAAAICAYMADAFPDAGLAPAPDARGAYYRWLFFAAGPVEAAVTNRRLGFEAEDKSAMLGYGSYDRVLDTLSGLLAARDYVAGDRFTAADVYLGSQVAWGLAFKTMEDRPGFSDYVARVSDRPAAKRAKELDDALMTADAQSSG